MPEIVVQKGDHLESHSSPEGSLIPCQEVRMPRHEGESLVRGVFDENIGEAVKALNRGLEALLYNRGAIRRHCHEREAPADGEVHRGDAPVGRVHRGEDIEVLRDPESSLAVK